MTYYLTTFTIDSIDSVSKRIIREKKKKTAMSKKMRLSVYGHFVRRAKFLQVPKREYTHKIGST